MKPHGRILALLVLSSSMSAWSMDGVCIATILNGATYKYGITFGQLVKYEIKSDTVYRVDTLPVTNGASARINMSGTYYAYVKSGAGSARTLVIKPLYGNPTAAKEIPLQSGAGWIWWVENNSFFYVQGTSQGDNVIRKLTIGGSGGQLTVTDRMWVRTQESIQGGFVGLDLTGTRLSYKAVTPTYACTVTGDSTQPPTNVDIGIIGCGNAVSPSGTWWTQFPGGHAAVGWGKWDGTSQSAVFYSRIDSAWCTLQPGSPIINLEARWVLWGYPEWMKAPVGIFGAENVWSQNSEDWFISEVGMALNGECECVNAIALNRRTSKAINISQIAPVKQSWNNMYNSSQVATEFRYSGTGPAFTNGTQRSADRPGLWCSTQEDVWSNLWHYVQDRQTDNQYWSDLLGLPLSEIPSTAVAQPSHGPASKIPAMTPTPSGLRVTLPGHGQYTVRVTGVNGRTVARLTGSGADLQLPSLRAGTYVLQVSQDGSVATTRFVCR